MRMFCRLEQSETGYQVTISNEEGMEWSCEGETAPQAFRALSQLIADIRTDFEDAQRKVFDEWNKWEKEQQ